MPRMPVYRWMRLKSTSPTSPMPPAMPVSIPPGAMAEIRSDVFAYSIANDLVRLTSAALLAA
jgi:hypothetical protein